MNQKQLKELVTQALEASLFEPTQPSVVVESATGSGCIEIPLVFANNFAELILRENQ
jgi:hypothetical protein